MRRHPMLLVALLLLCVPGLAAEDGKQPTPKPKAVKLDKAALEKEFARNLSGATLVGRFSIEGKAESAKAGTDRYEIEKAEKVGGSRWLITARVKYGKHDLKVPVPVDVIWADDTPVIELTDLTIPGLGTFTSRVLFYGDRYAGTWQHGPVGGHMWGNVEHGTPAAIKQNPKSE